MTAYDLPSRRLKLDLIRPNDRVAKIVADELDAVARSLRESAHRYWEKGNKECGARYHDVAAIFEELAGDYRDLSL